MSISVSILVFTLYSGHQDAAMATGFWQSYMPTIKHAEKPHLPLTQSHFGKLMDTRCRCGQGTRWPWQRVQRLSFTWVASGTSSDWALPLLLSRCCALGSHQISWISASSSGQQGELFHPHRAGAVVNKTQGWESPEPPCGLPFRNHSPGSESFLPNVQEQKSAEAASLRKPLTPASVVLLLGVVSVGFHLTPRGRVSGSFHSRYWLGVLPSLSSALLVPEAQMLSSVRRKQEGSSLLSWAELWPPPHMYMLKSWPAAPHSVTVLGQVFKGVTELQMSH